VAGRARRLQRRHQPRDDLVQQRLQVLVGWRGTFDKHRISIGALVHAESHGRQDAQRSAPCAAPRTRGCKPRRLQLKATSLSWNTLATSKPIVWFEQNLISHVPLPHAGFMRRVYPGFVRLSAFMSMNPESQKNAFKDLYRHLVDGDVEKANIIRVFYDEYMAVNDLARGVLS